MQSEKPSDPIRGTRRGMLAVITVILTGWALQATGAFMVPVVFSIFLALLVMPLDRWVAARVPAKLGWLGHVAAMGVILASLLIFVGLIWIAAQQVVDRFPVLGGGGPLLPQFGEEVRGGSGGSADSATAGSAGSAAVRKRRRSSCRSTAP